MSERQKKGFQEAKESKRATIQTIRRVSQREREKGAKKKVKSEETTHSEEQVRRRRRNKESQLLWKQKHVDNFPVNKQAGQNHYI